MKLRPDFLIIGMERSGTLWTSATLNEHPGIASFPNQPVRVSTTERPGEMHFFNTLASLEPSAGGEFTRPLEDYLTKYGRVFADLVPLVKTLPKKEFYDVMVRRYSEFCDKQRGNKKIVGESTPAYVFHLKFIDSLYPGIKKVCSIRDPKDKIVSWHFSCLSKMRKTETDITEGFALEYVHSRIVKEYEALLAYEGEVHCITYERMSHKPKDVVRGIVTYLGMDITDSIIETMIKKASFEEMTKRHIEDSEARNNTESYLQEKASLRKGIAGDWKNYIDSKLVKKIDDIVEPLRKKVLEKYHVET